MKTLNENEITILNENYPDGFWIWIEENGHIYRAFVEKALALKRRGKQRYGAKAIAEVIRYETTLAQRGEQEFKLNNNYVSGLARLAMTLNPQLDGFFQVRQ